MFKEWRSEVKRSGGLKGWWIMLCDKHGRKGRHSRNHIHLFYITPELYVGAHA